MVELGYCGTSSSNFAISSVKSIHLYLFATSKYTIRLCVCLLFAYSSNSLFGQSLDIDSVNKAVYSRWDNVLEPYSVPVKEYFYVGVYGGASINDHRGNISIIDNGSLCCQTTGGTNTKFHAGLKIFYPVSPLLSLSYRLAYEQRGAGLVGNPITGFIRGINQQREPASYQPELDFPMPTLCNDFFFELTPTRNIYIGAGFSLGAVLSKSYTYRTTILSPDDITYSNGQRSIDIEDATLSTLRTIQFGVKANAGFITKITKHVALNPELCVSLPITNFSQEVGVNWRAQMILFSIGVLWEFEL
jgi:hypothetical protein